MTFLHICLDRRSPPQKVRAQTKSKLLPQILKKSKLHWSKTPLPSSPAGFLSKITPDRLFPSSQSPFRTNCCAPLASFRFSLLDFDLFLHFFAPTMGEKWKGGGWGNRMGNYWKGDWLPIFSLKKRQKPLRLKLKMMNGRPNKKWQKDQGTRIFRGLRPKKGRIVFAFHAVDLRTRGNSTIKFSYNVNSGQSPFWSSNCNWKGTKLP